MFHVSLVLLEKPWVINTFFLFFFFLGVDLVTIEHESTYTLVMILSRSVLFRFVKSVYSFVRHL